MGSSAAALLLLIASVAGAQTVTFTAASSNTGSVTSGWDHTVPAGGQDRYLLIGVSVDWTGDAPTVQSASYAGMALTRLGGADSPGAAHVEIWGLSNPPEGLGLASVRLTANARFTAGAASFAGVDPGRGPGPFVSIAGSGTQASLNVPSAAGEQVFTVLGASATPATLAVESPQVARWWIAAGAGSSGAGGGGPAVTWNASPAQTWVLGAITLLPRLPASDGGAPDASSPDAGALDAPSEAAPKPDSGEQDVPGADRDAPADDTPAIDGPGLADAAAVDAAGPAGQVRGDIDVRIGCACRAGAAAPAAGGGLPWTIAAVALARMGRRARRSRVR